MEIFFVNELSLPFNSGTIFFFLIIITSIVLGLIKTKKHKRKNADNVKHTNNNKRTKTSKTREKALQTKEKTPLDRKLRKR